MHLAVSTSKSNLTCTRDRVCRRRVDASRMQQRCLVRYGVSGMCHRKNEPRSRDHPAEHVTRLMDVRVRRLDQLSTKGHINSYFRITTRIYAPQRNGERSTPASPQLRAAGPWAGVGCFDVVTYGP